MSAFIVSDTHINALITFAIGGGHDRIMDGSPQEMAQMLLNENYRSVNYRYRENEQAPTIRFRPYIKPLSMVAIIKLCNCYDYQACETDDYRDTPAAKLIERIRDKAIYRLPGYEQAPYSLDDPTHTVETVRLG